MKAKTMTYIRVVPRDLFNEANLLKCIGRLVLLIEDTAVRDQLQYHHDNDAFTICQDPGDGAIYVANVQFWAKGYPNAGALNLRRPLNSRETWPLNLETDEGTFPVFDDEGNFILDITAALKA